MKTVTSTVLNRKPGSVLTASDAGPVKITTRGVETHVMITAAECERLSGQSVPRPETQEHAG